MYQDHYSNEMDFSFKILLIGNSSVGKSSLLMRFADNVFHEAFLPTIGVDFKIRTIHESGSIVKLQMWDTAGQQKFRNITSSYYKGCQGIILVFDLSNRKSLDDIKSWLFQIQKYSNSQAVKVLIGNKSDLRQQRQVSKQEAQKFAKEQHMKYYETSAKNNQNVELIFAQLSAKMKQTFSKEYIQKYKKTTSYSKVIIIQNKDVKKSCC